VEPAVLQTLILNHPDASPLDIDVLNRLATAQEDAPAVVKQRYQNWKVNGSLLEDLFLDKVQLINVTDRSVSEIFSQVSETIENLYT